MNEFISHIGDKMITARRHLHKNPELSFKEFKTMEYICSYLDLIGVEYKSGIAGTGVLAEIKGKKPSNSPKTLLIRADIDALPVCEVSDMPYASVNSGIMHACGHDGHTAILLGVCEILNSMCDKFSGCIKLAFQPGEETTGGAKPMIDDGILENPRVDACIALHMDPDIDVGSVRIKSGSLYASPDDFRIKVIGRGGHAAEPQNCIDPILIAAKIITELSQLVPNEINPDDNAVVTVGTINAGTATNIIPDTAEITGTARSLSCKVRDTLKKRIGEIAKDVCNISGAECEYEFIELFPPLVNDDKLSVELYNTAKELLGSENCIYGGEPTMAGEDFAYFTQEVPSVLFKLGCRNKERGIINPLHHSSFDIDEDCLKYGAALFVEFALRYLG